MTKRSGRFGEDICLAPLPAIELRLFGLTKSVAQSQYLLRHHASLSMPLIRWVYFWTVLMAEFRMDLSVPRQRFEHVIQVS